MHAICTYPFDSVCTKGKLLIQFVQKAKAYQTVVRLGTYTHKVPTYNSLKACKGTMFFLPLPLAMATLDEVEESETT